jgi:hypothetical protein
METLPSTNPDRGDKKRGKIKTFGDFWSIMRLVLGLARKPLSRHHLSHDGPERGFRACPDVSGQHKNFMNGRKPIPANGRVALDNDENCSLL